MTMKTLPRGSGQQSADDSAPVVLATGSTITIPLPIDAATETTLALIKAPIVKMIFLAVTAAQTVYGTVATALQTLSIMVGWDSTNSVHKEVSVSTTGEINVANAGLTAITNRLSGSLVPVTFDNIAADLSGVLTDVYTYKLAAATVKTVTITYTDHTKLVISTVVAV